MFEMGPGLVNAAGNEIQSPECWDSRTCLQWEKRRFQVVRTGDKFRA